MEMAVPITLGSDAHKPEELAFGFERAIKLAKEIGYQKICIFGKRKKEISRYLICFNPPIFLNLLLD